MPQWQKFVHHIAHCVTCQTPLTAKSEVKYWGCQYLHQLRSVTVINIFLWQFTLPNLVYVIDLIIVTNCASNTMNSGNCDMYDHSTYCGNTCTMRPVPDTGSWSFYFRFRTLPCARRVVIFFISVPKRYSVLVELSGLRSILGNFLSVLCLTGLVLSADISASNRLTERNSEGSLTVGHRFEFG